MRGPGLGSWIERRAAVASSDLALVFGDERWTYGVLAERIGAAAALLHGAGVRHGDRVGFHGRNEPTALVSLFAAARLGAVWVPIHPARPLDEVEAVLADAEVSVLVRGRAETEPDPGCPILSTEELHAARGPDDVVSSHDSDLDEPVVLGYTSGTTGSPKGVVLSHANLTWNVVHMLSACAFSRTDVAIGGAPLTRVGGLAVTVLPTLFVGGTIALPTAGDGESVLRDLERERVTVLFANPDLLESLSRSGGWASADLSSIRTGVVGGGLVPEALLGRYADRGVLLRHGYGLTEAGPVVSLLDERDAIACSRSVGKTIGFVEARAVRDDGSDCEPDEIGEFAIRGPNVTSGYWRRPEATTAASLPGGWFLTGDAGSIDPDGYLTFVDRLHDAIRLSAGRVYPAELERLLYGTDGVEDSAAVDVDGRLIVAVVPRPGAAVSGDVVRERLRGDLPDWKLPSAVLAVDAIPRNAAGKILRARLRDALHAAPRLP